MAKLVSMVGFEHTEADRAVATGVAQIFLKAESKLDAHMRNLENDEFGDYAEYIAEKLEEGKDIAQGWMDEREAARKALYVLGFTFEDPYASFNEEAAHYRYAESLGDY